MATTPIQSELYTSKSLFTLGGSSAAVWLFTTVLSRVFGIDADHYKWIGLLVALVLSYVGVLTLKRNDIRSLTIAFFNGLLIYVTTAGIDSINQGVRTQKEIVVSASLLGSFFAQPWWPTASLKDSLEVYAKRLEVEKEGNSQLRNQIKFFADSLHSMPSPHNVNTSNENQLKNCLNRNSVLVAEKKRLLARIKMDSIKLASRTNAPGSAALVLPTKNDLEALKNLNKTLLKNLNDFIESEMDPQRQARALRTLPIAIDDLQGQIVDYNAKIDKMILRFPN
jgi:hypothetical protein